VSLILSPFRFANCTDNLTGTPPAVNFGTNFTAGANRTDGATVAVLTAIPHEVHYLVIAVAGVFVSNGFGLGCLDVRIDRAGGTSWASADLISNLICGYHTTLVAGTVGPNIYYHFPLRIPSGSSLGVRAYTAHTSDITTGQVAMWAFGNPSHPDAWWCGTKVETLGIVDGTDDGTSVTPGNSGAFGSWTSIGSTTSARYGALQVGVGGSDSSSLAVGYYWQVGIGSSQIAGTPNFFCCADTTERIARTGFAMPIFCDIPASSQMQLRATCSGTAEAYKAAVYGVY
jgi:hypothetical protein